MIYKNILPYYSLFLKLFIIYLSFIYIYHIFYLSLLIFLSVKYRIQFQISQQFQSDLLVYFRQQKSLLIFLARGTIGVSWKSVNNFQRFSKPLFRAQSASTSRFLPSSSVFPVFSPGFGKEGQHSTPALYNAIISRWLSRVSRSRTGRV